VEKKGKRTIKSSEEAYRQIKSLKGVLMQTSDKNVTMSDALDRLLGIKEVPEE
jgi:hypothetical protein